jgi:hypothetical protein
LVDLFNLPIGKWFVLSPDQAFTGAWEFPASHITSSSHLLET